jgi:hypothetical protein
LADVKLRNVGISTISEIVNDFYSEQYKETRDEMPLFKSSYSRDSQPFPLQVTLH